MPDLHALLAAEARRQEPEAAPDFDALVVRAQRRRARRGLGAVSAVVVLVLAVALGGWWLSPRTSTSHGVSAPSPTTTPASPVPADVYARLSALALAFATANGDSTPSRMEAVQVDAPVRAEASPAQSAVAPPPQEGGYEIEVAGAFTCLWCKGPVVHGSTLHEFVAAGTFAETDRGIGRDWLDLSRYGHEPFRLSIAPATKPLSAAAYARLRQLAVQLASGYGDGHPTRMETVAVADVNAAERAMSGGGGAAGSAGPGYVVQVAGTFVCSACSVPQGFKAPRGTVAYTVVAAGTFVGVGSGITSHWYDLSRLGASVSLAPETTVSPVATVAPVTTSPPDVHGPRTLAEAERLVLGGALDQGKARIAWGYTTDAGTLRAAGHGAPPPSVPDKTPMFVIAVHGDAMTDGGPGVAPKLVHRYGAVWRGDGRTDGDEAVIGAYPDHLEPESLPQAVVVAYSALEPMLTGFTPADPSELADAMPVQVAVAAALGDSGAQGGETVRAALAHTQAGYGHSGLAWVVEIHVGPSTATAYPPSQWVVDATTGEGYEAVQP